MEISLYGLEGSRPSRLIEEVNDGVQQKSQPVARVAHQVLVGRSNKRPVDEYRPPDQVLLGNEAPVTAVFAHVAVIAHAEVTVRWHYDVFALYVGGLRELPILAGNSIPF